MTTSDAIASGTGASGPKRPFRLSFLAFIEHSGISGNRSTALDEGLALFEYAAELGYDTGWVRHRHLERYLSSPLTFLTAASRNTGDMHLGTSVTPLGFEHPIRLAEDAATVDLLTGGRLEVGLSSGYSGFTGVFGDIFGRNEGDLREIVDERLDRFTAAVRAEATTVIREQSPLGEIGDVVGVEPVSPTLHERIAYGAGSTASAVRTGERGLRLQLSTLNTTTSELTFEEAQRETIRAYREAHAASPFAARTRSDAAVSRQVLPVTDASDYDDYAWLIERDRRRQAEQGTPEAALPFQFGKVVADSPEVVAELLRADVALQEADELIIALPFDHPDRVLRKILRLVAEEVAPALGWRPGVGADAVAGAGAAH